MINHLNGSFPPPPFLYEVNNRTELAGFSSLTLERPDRYHWSSSNHPHHRPLITALVLLHYTLILPLFALCLLALVRWLRRQGGLLTTRQLFRDARPPSTTGNIGTSLAAELPPFVYEAAASAASTIIPMMLRDAEKPNASSSSQTPISP